MDPISKFMVDHKIPIGAWGKAFFGFLTDNFDTIFRAFSNGLNFLLDGLVDVLLMVPPVLLALIIAGIAWLLQRSRPLAIGVFARPALHHQPGPLEADGRRRWCWSSPPPPPAMAIGVPLGIWAAHKPKVYRVMLPVLDLMQTLPTFVYLIPVLTLFGLGNAPGLIVTIIFVIPTAVRLTHLGVVSVPKSIVEAGEAFGATKRQLLWKVELPSALPTIMAGPDPVHHAVAVDGGVRGADRRRRPRHRNQPRARLAQASTSGLRRASPSSCSPSCSTG